MPQDEARAVQRQGIGARGRARHELRSMSAAATSSAIPMPSCTRRRDHVATRPAPSHAPTTAAPIISASVRVSTSTMAMKTSACATDGSAWPTFSVPGMSRSGTSPRNRKSDVVGANEPTPSVSKKSVSAPMPTARDRRRSGLGARLGDAIARIRGREQPRPDDRERAGDDCEEPEQQRLRIEHAQRG